MAVAKQQVAPPRGETGLLGWIRRNLFSTWYNGLLTLVSLGVLYLLLRGLIVWAVRTARWGVVTRNLRLLMIGSYPPEQSWRPATCVLIVCLLLGLSWAIWGRGMRIFALVLGGALGLLALFRFATPTRLWLLANPVAVALGYGLGLLLRRWRRAGLAALLAWLLGFGVTWVLLQGFRKVAGLPYVSMESSWGGLLLTFVLSIVGIVLSFPIGVLLALGRRSELPAVRILSIIFIEVVRGVPLVTVLFMANIMLPLFLPEQIRIERVVRAMAGMLLFSAAYTAENVRAGLQSIPEGQIEAAKALGLRGYQTTFLIVLPQALRLVIPANVGQFIALFKDTSLVAIIGLLDLLNIGRSVLAQPDFMGLQREVFLFIALIYGIFSYAMSYGSYRLEKALGLGER